MGKKIVLFLFIAIIGFGAFYFYQQSNLPKEIAYIQVKPVDYNEKILTTGTVLLEGLTDIKNEVSGKIVEVFSEEGDKVTAGAILLTFDTTDVSLDLKQAEANYTLAKTRYDEIVNTTCPTSREQYRQAQLAQQEAKEEVLKFERLYAQKAIPLDRLQQARHQLELRNSATEIQRRFMDSCAEGGAKRETAQAEIKSAQAHIDLLKNRLQKHTIRSPIRGIVIEKNKSLGEYAMVGEKLFTLAKEGGKYVEIELDERNLARIRLGQKVLISTEFAPENKIEGSISDIAPSVNAEKGTVKMKVKITEDTRDTDYLIKNLTVRCEIISAEYPQALVIPREYILTQEGQSFVFSYQNDRAEKRKVKIDNPNAREVRITEGVGVDEIILYPEGLENGREVVLKEF